MVIIYFIVKKFHTNILYVQSYRVSFSTNFLLLPVPVERIQTFCATSNDTTIKFERNGSTCNVIT